MYHDFISGLMKEESESSVHKDQSESNVGIDLSFFTSDKAKKIDISDDTPQSEDKPKRATRKKKEDPVVASAMVANDNLPMTASNVSYLDTYNETNNMLRGAIVQTDMLSAQVQEDLDVIRNSKTMRSKYTYLTNLMGSAASLISTKIQAIREIDGNITQGHNLDLKRAKDLKTSADEKNDDLKLMQMYDAFINIPVGTYNPNGVNPSLQALTTAIPNADPNIGRVNMNDTNVGADYNNYLSNLSPAANRARLEGNPNIKTVVVFDPNTGNRYFDVIDTTTNQSVPNVERPGEFLLNDTDIDVHNGVARNRNIDSTWPLVIVGGVAVTEY